MKLDNNVLTVKTAKGDVPVTLDAKTEITRGDKPAQAADLKAGVRVVVDIPEGQQDQTRAFRQDRQLPSGTRPHTIAIQPVCAVSPAWADAESR